MHLSKIGRAIYIVASPLSGITSIELSTYPCHQEKLQECNHVFPSHPQYCPYLPEPKRFGSEAQAPLPPNASPSLDAKGIKRIHQIVGSILYYTRAVNMIVLLALSSIAVKQTTAMARTMGWCIKLLDYLATNSHVQVRFRASDMIMNIHFDASYLSKTKARSHARRHFFMGWRPKNGKPIKLNGTFYVNTTILRFVGNSVADAKLSTLFHNCQDGIISRQTLADLGHPQT
jgi:hypothetical protein